MAQVVSAGLGYVESRQVKRAKEAEAEQLEKAADARRAAGTQDAYEQRQLGKKVESDAIAAMAAGGGVVDSDVVADIKSTADYNVMSALFASREEAKQTDLTARYRKFEGKMAKRFGSAKLTLSTAAAAGEAAYGSQTGGAPTTGGG